MKTLLVLGIALAGVLLFLLATASANTSLFAEHYSLLLGLNAMLAVALLSVVGYQLGSLRRRLKRRVFGSRLTLRFLVLFAAMALVPGVLVYTVSVQFLSKSIESWFDVSVDTALEGGLKLGQAAIDQMLAELNVKARAMAQELSDRTDSQQVVALNRLRQQAGVEDAVVVAANGRLVASASDSLAKRAATGASIRSTPCRASPSACARSCQFLHPRSLTRRGISSCATRSRSRWRRAPSRWRRSTATTENYRCRDRGSSGATSSPLR